MKWGVKSLLRNAAGKIVRVYVTSVIELVGNERAVCAASKQKSKFNQRTDVEVSRL